MHVVHVGGEVILVSDEMFPETTLPDARRPSFRDGTSAVRDGSLGDAFDLRHRAKILSLRQSNRCKCRKHDDRVGLERVTFPSYAKRIAETVEMRHEDGSSRLGDQREEISGAGRCRR